MFSQSPRDVAVVPIDADIPSTVGPPGFAASVRFAPEAAIGLRLPASYRSHYGRWRRAAGAAMKRVAIFGNAGGGKSTLAKRLAEITRLPLHVLDKMQYGAGGVAVPHEAFLKAHAELLRRDTWIIDGFGSVETAWERFAVADTLIHIDLPLVTHYWWVTKRLIKGPYVAPEGWPQNSPLWRSTMSSYGVLLRCHRALTPRYRQLVGDMAASKQVYRLKSRAEIGTFLASIDRATPVEDNL